MDQPVQVALDPEQRRRARRRAAEQGLTLADYISRLIEEDLEGWEPNTDAPAQVPVSASSDVLPHPGTYIGEAVAARMNRPPEPEDRDRR